MLSQVLGTRSLHWLFVVIMVLSTMAVTINYEPTIAYAADAASGGKESQVKARCEQIRQEVSSSDQDGVWLTEYIVECVRTVCREAFQEFINGFYPHMVNAIKAALTLAVTLLGLLILTQQLEKPNRDVFITLVKVGCVLYFVKPENVSWLYENGMKAMDELTDVVFQFGKGAGTSQRCPDDQTVFDRMDCVLDVMIGIKKPQNAMAGGGGGGADQYQGISRGLLYFFISNLSTKGGVGLIIALVGFYTAVKLLIAFIQSIHTYLAAILALSFILTLAPLFVPLLMFKATRTYFDKWHRIATSFILQPVILFGFLSFMLVALDKMLLSEDGFYGTVFGSASQQQNFNPNKHMEDAKAMKSRDSGYFWQGAVYTDSGAGAKVKKEAAGAFSKSIPVDKAAQGIDRKSPEAGYAHTQLPALDYSKLCEGMGDAAKCSQQTALSVISLALTAFVFVSVLNYIPNLATDLSGGIYEVPSLFHTMGSKLPGAQMLDKAMGGAADGITNRLRPAFESMITGRRTPS